jgi:hypothetical protein
LKYYEIKFVLDRLHALVITLDIPIEEIGCCYRIPVYMVDGKKKIILSNNTVQSDLQTLNSFLMQTLGGDFVLHASIVDDIGYLYNEYYQNKSKYIEVQVGRVITWVGYKYQLWQAYYRKKRFVTWMYNNVNGDIIFEITPFYPFLFCNPAQEPNYIIYEEWIKKYKPYFIKIISREIAQQWLVKSSSILEQIDKNIVRWETGQ